jgi:tetratricopeptide repeat protein 30
MMENIAKCTIMVDEEVLEVCLHFLEQCEIHGREISTETNVFIQQSSRIRDLQKTVAKEARALRALMLTIME